MVFNTTFNNISVLSWRSVFLVEITGVPREITDLIYFVTFCFLLPFIIVGFFNEKVCIVMVDNVTKHTHIIHLYSNIHAEFNNE
jgi:hypothetical protein